MSVILLCFRHCPLYAGNPLISEHDPYRSCTLMSGSPALACGSADDDNEKVAPRRALG
jgi:hypothetical protein